MAKATVNWFTTCVTGMRDQVSPQSYQVVVRRAHHAAGSGGTPPCWCSDNCIGAEEPATSHLGKQAAIDNACLKSALKSSATHNIRSTTNSRAVGTRAHLLAGLRLELKSWLVRQIGPPPLQGLDLIRLPTVPQGAQLPCTPPCPLGAPAATTARAAGACSAGFLVLHHKPVRRSGSIDCLLGSTS